jgi:beta-lactamase regulating signal transducer with metallopeptidase domain
MVVAVYLPLLSAAAVGLFARWLAHRLPPATVTRLLTLAAVVTAVACSFSLGVLAFLLIAHVPAVAALGHWSTSVLQADNHIPLVVSVAGALASLAVTALLLTVLYRYVRAVLDARAHCARIGGEPGRLVVLDSDRADAYALSAGRGRVVVTRRLLQGLSAPERRALLAHERAHLDCHHHRYRLVVALAAALCPLLRPARGAVDYATERWADETAADETADRSVVATTLAHTSVLISANPAPRPSLALANAGGAVVRRVQALLMPAPRQRPLLVVLMLAVIVLALLAGLDVRNDTEHLLEAAFNAWTATG